MLAAGMRARLVVVPAVTGLVVGYALITVVVAAGVAPVIAAAPAALLGLTVAGAGYLVHLGVAALRSPDHAAHAAPGTQVAAKGARILRRGIGVSALNPKSLLFFLAFLPQFARPTAAWPLAVQLAVLGGVWAVISAVVYTALGYTAGKAMDARPHLARAVTRVAGAVMVLAGIALLGEQLVHELGTMT